MKDNKESDLYFPVKHFLNDLGYSVKAEVKDCDVVAIKHASGERSESLLIVELKLKFSLELLLQGVNRQALCDNVYLAIGAAQTAKTKRNWRTKEPAYLRLCKKLGLGLMLVQPKEQLIKVEAVELIQESQVRILLDPAPYQPRKNSRRRTALLKEFNARVGDPNLAGINKTQIITAYRQNTLQCAEQLQLQGPCSIKQLRQLTQVDSVASIMQKNYYGWFARVTRGVYELTDKGQQAVLESQVRLLDTSA